MLAWTVIQLALVLQPQQGSPLRARPRPPAPVLLLASERDDDGAPPGSPGWLSGRVPPPYSRRGSREVPPGADAAAEYDLRVAEAQAAISAAEAARKRLAFEQHQHGELLNGLPPEPSVRRRRWGGARRCTVSRSDAGTLLIELPAAGILRPDAVMGGAFSIAWFSAVVPATLRMIASGGGLFTGAFMLPFWLAGGVVAKQSLVEPARSASISIGEFAWEIRSSVIGLPLGERGGPTEELEGATVEVSVYVNGVPSYELRLRGADGVYSFGTGLEPEELAELADEINLQIASSR